MSMLCSRGTVELMHLICTVAHKSRGGYSHIWAIRVCAAQQGMVFASLTLEQGIKIALSLWNRVYFISGLTLE